MKSKKKKKGKKTSTIKWIKITKKKPKDLQYVLGAFEINKKGKTLVFAMHYIKRKGKEAMFVDSDGVKRNENTKENIIYWAKMPVFEG